MPLLVHAPDGSGTPLVAFAICHAGPLDRAEAEVRPLLELGSPVMAQVGPMPYPAINMMLDAGFPPGILNYWKSSFIRALDDEAIDVMVERFAECPSPMTGIAIEHFHGAVTRVDESATAFSHREPGFNFLVASMWTDPAATDENIAWTRATYAAMEPHFAAKRYVNYLDDDERVNAVRASYGPNYSRLAEVKGTYDPDNVFRLNQNVPPAAA